MLFTPRMSDHDVFEKHLNIPVPIILSGNAFGCWPEVKWMTWETQLNFCECVSAHYEQMAIK